jgi:hypothetical protein
VRAQQSCPLVVGTWVADAISGASCSDSGSWRARTLPASSQRVICRSGSWATKASYTVRAILSRLSLASDVCVLILLTSPPVRLASDYYSDDCLRLLWPRCHGLQQSQRDWDGGLDRHKKEPPGSPRSRGSLQRRFRDPDRRLCPTDRERRLFHKYSRYQEGGIEALEDGKPRPQRSWNKIPDKIRTAIVSLALE